MARNFDLIGENAIVKGETFKLTIVYPDADFTQWQMSGQIRKTPISSEILAAFSFPVKVFGDIEEGTNPISQGTTIVAELTAAQTATLPKHKVKASVRDPVKIGRTAWCYDIEATNGSDTIKLVTLSAVEVVLEVTR